MSKELMEMLKLMDYKFDEKHRTNPFTLDAYIDGWKHCKSEMLEIIESYKPKVLNEPNDIGYWWFYDDREEEWFPVFIHVPGAVIVNIDSDRWIKADTSIFPMKIAGKG
jgi:hypothetical protein